MSIFERIIIIVLDGVGAGAAPDAADFGDEGSNTLLHIHRQAGLKLPQLAALGMSNIIPLSQKTIHGAYGIMNEKSCGKDTTSGHWELAGLVINTPFPTYPQGFPEEIIEPFCRETGRGILCNRPYSGTEVIKDLGDEHLATGNLIVYTSADSVFQIAAHEGIVPIEELYRYCEIARKLLTGKHAVGRVIARPFTGESGNYIRTERRHDYSLFPTSTTVLDHLNKAGKEVIGIGKIEDIFAGQGLTESLPVKGNPACIQATLDVLKKKFQGLVFVNLVDFDSLYGHRNNVTGFAQALEEFDRKLPEIIENMNEKDLLILTADHGNDPTTPSTDHSRESVPLLAFHKKMSGAISLGTRDSFADVAKTIEENFSLIDRVDHGESFLTQVTDS